MKDTDYQTQKNKPIGECMHDLAERETMCADGWCPICLQSALRDADAALAAERESSQQLRELMDSELKRMEKEIQQLREQLAKKQKAWDDQFTAAMTILGQTKRQLAAAQAAIVEHNKHVEEMHTSASDDCYEIPLSDTTALDTAIAEARQPLVSELQNIVNCDLSGMRKDFGDDTDRQFRLWAKSRAKAELEKVKEGKV